MAWWCTCKKISDIVCYALLTEFINMLALLICYFEEFENLCYEELKNKYRVLFSQIFFFVALIVLLISLKLCKHMCTTIGNLLDIMNYLLRLISAICAFLSSISLIWLMCKAFTCMKKGEPFNSVLVLVIGGNCFLTFFLLLVCFSEYYPKLSKAYKQRLQMKEGNIEDNESQIPL